MSTLSPKLLLTCLLFLSGCLGPKKFPIGEAVYRPGYSYLQVEPGVFYVIAVDNKNLKAAMKELECGTCMVMKAGEFFIIHHIPDEDKKEKSKEKENPATKSKDIK